MNGTVKNIEFDANYPGHARVRLEHEKPKAAKKKPKGKGGMTACEPYVDCNSSVLVPVDDVRSITVGDKCRVRLEVEAAGKVTAARQRLLDAAKSAADEDED